MVVAIATGDHLLRCLERSEEALVPFRHWRLFDVFPAGLASELAQLPLAPQGPGDSQGKRATGNHLRQFFAPAICRRLGACRAVADGFLDPLVVGRLERLCGIELCGGFLRIEYCQDRENFWLEPHTDIGAKLLTLQVYLSPEPEALAWGTDLLDGEWQLVTRVPAAFNSALLFVPAADSWHAFGRRPISGIRRSIIVNYVKPEWRSRHELVDKHRPVGVRR
jgi:hypothetical protein